jgi:acetyl-CoA acetyltransferase
MSPNATVIVVAATGHVLGMVTHEGDPDGAPSAAAVAGEAFPLRDGASGDVFVDVPVAELATSAVPVVDDLLRTPQSCAVADGAAIFVPASASVALAGKKIKISGAQRPPKDVDVRVFVEHGQGSDRQRAVLKGKLLKGAQELTFPSELEPGDYDAVAAVPGNAPAAASLSVPP